ncbi:SGNH/GDSL hydrolase family protein [Anabaena sp. CCY 9402-a]|uniref:SGNH/GDSL hydrolase family protein n=1 Tax=Anabaena sp. CCY 9402-a TaxID=3103867 RepID=UPI0039C60783
MNKRFIKSRQFRIIISIIVTLVTSEITLRFLLGLGHPVLSQADNYTGYRFQPNQQIFRFGKIIKYNQYSQRSAPITPQKPQGKFRILMLGDSVLNGGNPTDQKQIITELLKTKIQTSEQLAEVLNASAGSWGIGNQLGYLKKFGTFESDIIIMQIGTHDITQPTSTSERIGLDPNYPEHPPLLAIQEALTRYIIPRLLGDLNLNPVSNKEIPQIEIMQKDQQFQENMKSLTMAVNIVREKQIPIYVLFTPNRDDLIPQPITPPHKQEFMQVLKSLQVPLFDTYEAWSKLPTNVVNGYYRDEVHLNEKGNESVATLIYKQLCSQKKIQGCSL